MALQLVALQESQVVKDGKISSLESEVTELSAKSAAAEERAKSLESNIADLQAGKQTLANDLEETKSRLQASDEVSFHVLFTSIEQVNIVPSLSEVQIC